MGVNWRLLKAVENLLAATSDSAYLRFRYWRRFGRWPQWRNPRSFNEHLLKYKITSIGDPRLPRLADKILAKHFVAELVGENPVIPTLWHGTELPAVEERTWPKPYVIKSSHGCGQNIFVTDESPADWAWIEEETRKWVAADYARGRRDREWHYGQIEPRLLVEPMLRDGDSPPPDYKLCVFGGRVGLIWKDEARHAEHRRYLFDRDWNPLPFDFNHRRGPSEPEPPATLPEMVEMAERLGAGFEFVRVDLYELHGRIYFGEFTFFPAGGIGRFNPPQADYTVGRLWQARKAKAKWLRPFRRTAAR